MPEKPAHSPQLNSELKSAGTAAERLLTRHEIVGLIELRPANVAEAMAVVPDMEGRFAEDERARIVACVRKTLPPRPVMERDD